MDSLLYNYCVGVIVNSECHKQHFTTNKSLLILRELEDEIQRVIKLRIECENISTICAHHYSIYFQYYDTPQFNFSKNCCDQFKKHKRVVRGSSKIDLKLSDSVFELKNDLRLIPGKTLCPRCYMQVTKIKNLEPQSPRNEENDQLDFIDNGDVTPFSVERVITPRRVMSALSNTSIITPVSDLNKSNTERRSRICVKVLDNLKRNILDIDHDPENVSYKQWTHMDGNKLETILAERDDYIEKLVALVDKLTTHHFVARNQSAYFVQSKENIDHETCVLVSDFSENFSFVIQDSVQGYYWLNDQATLLPFMVYMKKIDGSAWNVSMCIINAVRENEKVIENRMLSAIPIQGTRKFHAFVPINLFQIKASCLSGDQTEFITFDVLPQPLGTDEIDVEEKEFIVMLMSPDGESGLLQGYKHTKTKITVLSSRFSH
uniref:Uncharacterized protein n=1 Tax=Daphnia galeata TaxID=27404 RepID=A0A8J2WF38_9CRUS|nr:unnamed protein product [Daphnia galeata]